jgi:IPT/TIG domain-containing protein
VPRLIVQVALLALLVSLTFHPLGSALALDPAAGAPEPDPCSGDETLSSIPADPVAGEDLLVVATSARHHRGVTLLGNEHAKYQGETVGRQGWVWTWLVAPKLAGEHHFHLYVDTTTTCGEIAVEVGPARSTPPGGTSTSVDNGNQNTNDNADDNGNSDDNGNDNGSNSNSSSNSNNGNGNDNREKARPPKLDSVTPAGVCAGGRVTLKGQNFGRSQAKVGGRVVIANAPVVVYLVWHPTEIVALVPNGALNALAQDVYVVNDAGFDKRTVDVFAAPC